MGAARPRSAAPRPGWVSGVVLWGLSPPFPSLSFLPIRFQGALGGGGLKHFPPIPVLLGPIQTTPVPPCASGRDHPPDSLSDRDPGHPEPLVRSLPIAGDVKPRP